MSQLLRVCVFSDCCYRLSSSGDFKKQEHWPTTAWPRGWGRGGGGLGVFLPELCLSLSLFCYKPCLYAMSFKVTMIL